MNQHPGFRILSPPKSVWAAWVALALLLLLMLYPSPAFPWSPVPQQPSALTESDYREIGRFLQAHTSEDAVVVSDAYWLVSWYGDRTSLWFPVDLETLAEIEQQFVGVDAVFLTPTFISAAARTNPVWQNLYERPAPFGEFQVVKEFTSARGLRAVLFLKQEAQP